MTGPHNINSIARIVLYSLPRFQWTRLRLKRRYQHLLVRLLFFLLTLLMMTAPILSTLGPNTNYSPPYSFRPL